MTAASAPEEGRKCFFKASYGGNVRMVEWNTAMNSFKELDTKVRRMFGLNDKVKLNYTYMVISSGIEEEITMSSDEEVGTALHLLVGEVLPVSITLAKKHQKSPCLRILRAAKAQQPRVAECLASLQATARARIASLSAAPLFAIVAALRANANCATSCASARFAHARAAPCRRKVFLGFFFLFLALIFAHAKCSHRRDHYQYQSHTPQYSSQYQWGRQNSEHITILAATYGGVDVTDKAREYFNNNGAVLAANRIFGDPSPLVHKYLHVVYQVYSAKTGLAEVYSQSFSESQVHQQFSWTIQSCAFPEEAIVDGKSIKVLGAMYEDVVATCAARRLAATGRFSTAVQWHADQHKDSMVSKSHFGSNSNGMGAYTMVYLKDNRIRVFRGKEGSPVKFDN